MVDVDGVVVVVDGVVVVDVKEAFIVNVMRFFKVFVFVVVVVVVVVVA